MRYSLCFVLFSVISCYYDFILYMERHVWLHYYKYLFATDNTYLNDANVIMCDLSFISHVQHIIFTHFLQDVI